MEMDEFDSGEDDGRFPRQISNTPERNYYCGTGIIGVVKLLLGKSNAKSSAPKIITATTEIPKDAVIDAVDNAPNDTSNNTLERIDTPPYAAFQISQTDKGFVIGWAQPSTPDNHTNTPESTVRYDRIMGGMLGAYTIGLYLTGINVGVATVASTAMTGTFIWGRKRLKSPKLSTEQLKRQTATLPQRRAEIDASGQPDQAFVISPHSYNIPLLAEDVVEPVDSKFDLVQLANSVGINVEGTKKQYLPRRIKDLEEAQKRVNLLLTMQINNQASGKASNTLAQYVNITESLQKLRQEQATDAATEDTMEFTCNPAESLYTIFQTRGLDTDALVISTIKHLQTIIHAQHAYDSVMAELVSITKSKDNELLQDVVKRLALTAQEHMNTIFYAILDIKVAALHQQQQALGELL